MILVLLRILGMIVTYAIYVLMVRYLILDYSIRSDIWAVRNAVWQWAYRYEPPVDVTIRRLSALRSAVEQGKFSDDTGILEGYYHDDNGLGKQQSSTNSGGGIGSNGSSNSNG